MPRPLTLTTRLLLVFLGSLAAVLVGFSVLLWLLARNYINSQAEERLEAALNTLAAAAEVAPDGTEWEPQERSLQVADGPLGARIAWAVADEAGDVLDESIEGAAALIARATAPTGRSATNGSWIVRERRLIAPPRGRPSNDSSIPGQGHRGALTITAGVSLSPVSSALRNLAAVLAVLSAAVWLAAFGVGRRVCRTALRPVSRMTAAACEMDAADLRERLPQPATGDELDGLAGAFNGLLDRLEESFERQRRFTGDASHQLRTPLAALLGQIEVTLRRERPAEEYRRVLAAVHVQAHHLRQIVEALLFLARTDAEAQSPAFERLELRRWLAEHLASRSDGPRAGDVRFETDLTECPVETHPALLAELVNVLLDNALKYSPPRSPVTVRLDRHNGRARLAVEDRGVGIRATDLPRVFEPFFRTEDARRGGAGGVGLGLAVAERLAKALGGRVEAESQFGEGSRFSVRLPSPSDNLQSHDPRQRPQPAHGWT